MTRVQAAQAIADNAINAVIDAIRSEIHDRRENALWWAHFHVAMYAALPSWRWLARITHRNAARRFRAMVLATMSTVCARSLPTPV